MAMPLADRLNRRAIESLAGRRKELDRLRAFALGKKPLAMYVHGIPGVGKTHLLNALEATIIEENVSVARVDARWCEPSAAALCRAISKEIGAPETDDAATVADRLSHAA